MVEVIDTPDGDGYGYGDYGDYGGYGGGYGGYGDGGDGYGYGDYGDYGGYGYGYGDGDEKSREAYMATLLDVPRADELRRAGAVLAFWRSNANGLPANGGQKNKPAEVGDVHEERGPLIKCGAGVLHATWHPHEWQGERLWIVAMWGDVCVSNNKLSALKREIVAEVEGFPG